MWLRGREGIRVKRDLRYVRCMIWATEFHTMITFEQPNQQSYGSILSLSAIPPQVTGRMRGGLLLSCASEWVVSCFPSPIHILFLFFLFAPLLKNEPWNTTPRERERGRGEGCSTLSSPQLRLIHFSRHPYSSSSNRPSEWRTHMFVFLMRARMNAASAASETNRGQGDGEREGGKQGVDE